MHYSNAVEFIEKIPSSTKKTGFDRINELLRGLGDPQNHYQVIHVAGTNGKGSTCAMLYQILLQEGYSVGFFSSPHLVQYTERIQADGKEISPEEFGYYMDIVQNAAAQMERDGFEHPTLFELLTALAFLYFQKKQVRFVILETGLGGRLDPTNVVEKPLVSIITAIGFDHEHILGSTIEEIAREKGGIIKKKCPVVLCDQKEEVYNVLQQICEEKQAKLYYPKFQDITIFSESLTSTTFGIYTNLFRYDKIKISMPGTFQITNAVTALWACHCMIEAGVDISEDAILKGLFRAHWAGRMEIFYHQYYTILDGAHNEDGIRLLVHSLKRYFPDKKITLLIGMLEDKHYKNIVRQLSEIIDIAVITKPTDSRALSTVELAREFNLYKVKCIIEKDNLKAYRLAQQLQRGILLCTGSLYLIGNVRQYVLNNQEGRHD